MPKPTPDDRRRLEWWEEEQLRRQGCTATDWALVRVAPGTDLELIREVEFIGNNSIGNLDRERTPGCGLYRLTAKECTFGDDVRVRNIGGRLRRCRIGDRAVIENCARIEFHREAACGRGTMVNVLDETGSRPVMIYPGLTAQSAAIMARLPRKAEEDIIPQTETYLEKTSVPPVIGEDSVIRDCGAIVDVAVGREVHIEGARSLKNGSIVNNAPSGRCLAYIGSGVDAENFILEDGRLDAGCIIRNCYIGQGASIEKGYTAHDSLFFANAALENGEACALFAGPYTVSMHKGTLLIGCQTSFMNAGSSTNQSNHMYKLGPVHWGVLERGVKTSSNSYLMLGANIGAFSLLMGQHKTHPDSTEFPFSYLFGDARGATVVVPAVMLRSCGLLRDEKKWPTRDKRVKARVPLHDRVNFEVLNPYTIARVLKAMEIIRGLLQRPADDDLYLRYKGMKISRASLDRAQRLYTLALYKYLSTKISEDKPLPDMTVGDAEKSAGIWVDLAGQLMPRPLLDAAVGADSVPAREAILDDAFAHYEALEREWIAAAVPAQYLADREAIKAGAAEFDALVEADRTDYRDNLSAEWRMLSL